MSDTEDFVDQLFDALNSKVFLRGNGGGDGDVANAGDGRDEVEGAQNDETADVRNGDEEGAKSTTKPVSRDASSGDENGRRFPPACCHAHAIHGPTHTITKVFSG